MRVVSPGEDDQQVRKGKEGDGMEEEFRRAFEESIEEVASERGEETSEKK